MMTWVERKVATSYCADFPTATIDEALVAFQNSEALKPGHWIDNQLYLAKVCIIVSCHVSGSDFPQITNKLCIYRFLCFVGKCVLVRVHMHAEICQFVEVQMYAEVGKICNEIHKHTVIKLVCMIFIISFWDDTFAEARLHLL